MNDRIGVVGIGLMGRAFCERLTAKGYRVTAFNRTKREEHGALTSLGINVVDDAAKVVRDSELIILSLGDAHAIRGVLQAANLQSAAGKTFIQMGTIAPQESVEIATFIERSASKYRKP